MNSEADSSTALIARSGAFSIQGELIPPHKRPSYFGLTGVVGALNVSLKYDLTL